MKKPYFGLVFAVATLASAIYSASPAGAVNFVYDNVTYDVTTRTGSYWDISYQAFGNALWGNASLAEGLAGVVKGDLGYPNSFTMGVSPYFFVRGPYFAYGPNLYPYPLYLREVTGYYSAPCYGGGDGCFFTGQFNKNKYDTATYAIAVPSAAVPEPLTILGSIAATGFLSVFNRIKNKQEE